MVVLGLYYLQRSVIPLAHAVAFLSVNLLVCALIFFAFPPEPYYFFIIFEGELRLHRLPVD